MFVNCKWGYLQLDPGSVVAVFRLCTKILSSFHSLIKMLDLDAYNCADAVNALDKIHQWLQISLPVRLGLTVVTGPQEGGGRGGRPPPFRRMKTFLYVSLFRKLIIHENLSLKLFCSSKIVDFRVVFSKISAAQPYFLVLLPHIYDLSPPIFFEH